MAVDKIANLVADKLEEGAALGETILTPLVKELLSPAPLPQFAKDKIASTVVTGVMGLINSVVS